MDASRRMLKDVGTWAILQTNLPIWGRKDAVKGLLNELHKKVFFQAQEQPGIDKGLAMEEREQNEQFICCAGGQ